MLYAIFCNLAELLLQLVVKMNDYDLLKAGDLLALMQNLYIRVVCNLLKLTNVF